MAAPPQPGRTAWIVAPPQLCVLCREPLANPAEVSAWNGTPAHRDCVRMHLLQRDPAFRDWGTEDAANDLPDEGEDGAPRDDDDESPG